MSAKLENLLLKLGEPGKLQVIGAVFLVYSFLHAVTMNFIMSFVSLTPPHTCKLPPEWMWPENESIPHHTHASGIVVSDSCHLYVNPDNHSLGVTPCFNGYVYHHKDDYERLTVSTEYDLVCNLKYAVRIYQLCYFVGVIVGGVLGGLLSDAVGRRRVWLLAEVLFLTSGVVTYFCRNLFVANSVMVLHGMAMQSKLLAVHALAMELFPGKYRTMVGIATLGGPGLSFAYAAILAYFITHWRAQILVHALLTLFFVIGYWLLPESIRWLLTHRQTEDALAACHVFARFNGITLPFSIEREIHEVSDEIQSQLSSAKKQTMMDLLRYGVLRKCTFIMSFAQFTAQLCMYGFSFLVSELGGNIYVNCIIISVFDTTLRFSSYFTVKSLGRKKMTLLTLFVLGVTNLIFVVTQLFAHDNPILKLMSIVVGMTGRVFNGIFFCAFFILISEVFPTTVRSSAQGLVTATGRAGLMATPLMLFMSDYIWKQLPFVIFGVMGIVACALCSLLPETKDRPMPNTIEEAVRLSKKPKLSMADVRNEVEMPIFQHKDKSVNVG